MKKYVKLLSVVLLVFIGLNFTGCIFDSLDKLTQEVPVTVDLSLTGSETNTEQSETFDLNESDFYSKNRDKINKIEFIEIAYKTKSVSPANLSGNISLVIKQSNGTVIFSKNIPGAQPSAYLINPYKITLSQTEIQLLNSYLTIVSNRKFIATVKVENATAGDKTIEAQIFIVFNMDYEG